MSLAHLKAMRGYGTEGLHGLALLEGFLEAPLQVPSMYLGVEVGKGLGVDVVKV